MRKKHKNEIFNNILSCGLSPSDFNLIDDIENLPTTTIGYKDTPFKFVIYNSGETYDDFECEFVKYAHNFPMSEIYPDQYHVNFDAILDLFKNWINYHIKEYEQDLFEPDLWSEFKEGNSSIKLENIDFNDRKFFSNSERQQITMAINELKLLLHKNFNTTQEEQLLINNRLDYLIEACDRLNKLDWKSLILSTIIGISTTLSLDVEKGKILFELFRQVFTSIKIIPQ